MEGADIRNIYERNAVYALLGSLMASGDDRVVIGTVFDLLAVEDLPEPYQEAYSVLIRAWDKFGTLDFIGLMSAIINGNYKRKHELLVELNNIHSEVVSDSLWKHYLKLVLSIVKGRKLNAIGQKIGSTDTMLIDIDEIMQQATADIESIASKYTLTKSRSLRDITSEYLSDMDKIIITGEKYGIRTGLTYEDNIGGYRPGDFILIGGRPKMGKSAVANHIVCECLKENIRVLYVNNEMSNMSVINRIIANLTGISTNRINQPEKMSEREIETVMQGIEKLQSMPLELECMTMKKISDIDIKLSKMRDEGKPAQLVILDYLQLFVPSGQYTSRYERVSDLSTETRLLAADHQVPVIALSQLSRAVESRENKRPVASDLRDSGTLEQDATAVLFIYRDDYYYPDSPTPGMIEINVALSRNGSPGMSEYFYDFDRMRIMKIDSVSDEHALPEYFKK